MLRSKQSKIAIDRIVGARLTFVAAAIVLLAASLPTGRAHADNSLTIERVKPSVVAVGTYERTRTPQFQFLGTGFAVGDGTLIATNSHVLPKLLDPGRQEILAIMIPAPPKDGKEP